MIRTGFTILALLALAQGGCLSAARQGVQDQSSNVTFTGSFNSTGGDTTIYFGSRALPLATTTNSASFTVDVPRDIIEQSEDRRLYFYSSQGEAAVSSEILTYEVGTRSLGTIALQPLVTL